MMLTSLKDKSKLYSYQIDMYGGKLSVQIMCSSSYYRDSDTRLWISIADKTFGSMWQKTPTEQNWIDARSWGDEQLRIIEQYGTEIIVKPTEIRLRDYIKK